MLDSRGMIALGREGMNTYKDDFARRINPDGRAGTLEEAMRGADVFIGVSQPGLVTADMIRSMAENSIIFALANPVPEIMPNEALAAGAAVVATGRSDFPNQINNALAFPGIFKGALEARVRKITPAMRLRAAHALSKMITQPTHEQIIPSLFDERVAGVVAEAIKREI